MAAIYLDRNRPKASQWVWSVRYYEARDHGMADEKQVAADAATAAWPDVVERGRRMQIAAEDRAKTMGMIDHAAAELEPDVSIFQIEAASYENLMAIMDEARRRAATPGLRKLMTALSAEFFRRRTRR